MHINGGDYLVPQYENVKFALDFDLDGTAVATTLKQAVKSGSYQIFVQRIVLSYITHVATKVFTIQDDAGTPVKIANRADLAAAAGVPDVQEWNFGPQGTPLTLGKNLMVVANTGGTGFTARVHIEGYQKLAATIGMNDGAALQ
jgi:hypothetical protein